MSPQLRPSVPGPSRRAASFTAPTFPSDTAASHGGFCSDLRWLREEEDFQGQMPRAARHSSWRSDSTYPQKAHNEGQCSKQQDLTRALQGRIQELGGSRPLLRKPIDVIERKSSRTSPECWASPSARKQGKSITGTSSPCTCNSKTDANILCSHISL